jgi:amino acid adenylation domain-containing protein
VWNGVSYSYRVLNERANQLARYLRSQSIAMESRVALCMDRSLEMVTALLGVLKAGAAYVPIDPLYPQERSVFMIRDSGARLLLTQTPFAENFHGHKVSVIALDEIWPTVVSLPASDFHSGTLPENLAYVLYTSGTTGEPKGIEITHGALVNHSIAMAKHYGLQPSDRVLQFASISFDVAAEECFPTWAAGATVVLRPNEPVPAFSDFRQFIEDHGLTVLNLPTPYWAEWIGADEQSGTAPPNSIRLVIVGSEKAIPDSLVRWQRLAGERIAWCNSYGPTEATITASYFVPDPQTNWSSVSTVPIGRPIANVELYVLDPALQPVPIGVTGELYIGGLGLARGYHHQPARTAEKFVPHCFSREPGHRMYKTGDRVRRLGDGNVEFLGRYDDQVKVRGFRVEPAEIEFWMKQHPAVKDARVFQELSKQPGSPIGATGESRLVGCIVPRAGVAVTVQDLRHFLGDRLPGYMIPSAWVFLDAFPLTSRGKVDRQALKGLTEQIQERESTSAPLQTDTERAIADVWKEVLDLQTVGRQDNFFDLGGHSLLLGKVLTRVRSLSKRSVAMVDLFKYPTVQALAAYVTGDDALVENRGSFDQAESTEQAKERRVAGAQRLKRQRGQRRTITRGI